MKETLSSIKVFFVVV